MNPNKTEMQNEILIVDDQLGNLDLLISALEPQGYKILLAPNGDTALKVASRAIPNLILLDIMMPGMDGFEVCRRLKENELTQDIPIIFVTVKDKKEDIVKGFRLGGVDYIIKPIEIDEVLVRIETHLKINRLTKRVLQQNAELREANEQLRQEIARREQVEEERNRAKNALKKADEQLELSRTQEASRWGIENFIGTNKNIAKVLDEVRKVQEVNTTTVLITGESGTGKELIARAIHFGGTRKKAQFVPVNCSAIPGELAESFLFGHIRGSFTGAVDDRKGYFELADGGTLFFDEIGIMPLEIQGKLLRVLEDGCFKPVGSLEEKNVNVRILAATNSDLHAKIADGTFREDLYFRLAQFIIEVPPLRERKEDIPLLTKYFLNMLAPDMGIEPPVLTPEALSALEAYHFPGNVRELKNIIENALIRSRGSAILTEHLHLIQQPILTNQESPVNKTNSEDSGIYQFQNDSVRKFIDECCGIEPYAVCHKPSLLEAYQFFCAKNEFHPASRNEFNERIMQLCPQVTPTLIGKKRLAGLKGIKLKDSF